MKNILLLFCFFPCVAFGQQEKMVSKKVADKFKTYYNNSTPDSIFAMFSPEMKTALPAEKTADFLLGLMSQAGNINQMLFERYENSYASYKANFEGGIFAVNISVDQNEKMNGLFIKPYVPIGLPQIKRNTTKLLLPFKEEWTVIWGGDTKELNYHVESQAQKNAFDLLITGKQGLTHKGDGLSNDDYYAFGKEIIAPCDGEVVMAVDGVKDNKPGDMNPIYATGNAVIIKTTNNEYLLFAHFKQSTVAVKEGQKVKRGELLGLCGNSGNSSEPHLHFHIQNVENMNQATGVKCYFDKLLVNGVMKNDYSPIKGEKIKNE